jgi:hypothetical protein
VSIYLWNDEERLRYTFKEIAGLHFASSFALSARDDNDDGY